MKPTKAAFDAALEKVTQSATTLPEAKKLLDSYGFQALIEDNKDFCNRMSDTAKMGILLAALEPSPSDAVAALLKGAFDAGCCVGWEVRGSLQTIDELEALFLKEPK